MRAVQRAAVFLAPDCLARGHRVDGGPSGPSRAIGYADHGHSGRSHGLGADEELAAGQAIVGAHKTKAGRFDVSPFGTSPYSVVLSADAYTAVSATSGHGYPLIEHIQRLLSSEII